MKQPKYKRGSYKVKNPPMVQCNIRMHEHEKPLVKEFLKDLRCKIQDFISSKKTEHIKLEL